MPTPRFNYIITIHNKEDLIEEVLMAVLMCCRDGSHVFPVIDGCTDGTEEVIDRLVERFSGVPITKVHTPDVHELLSINAGLRAASQEGEGFNIILQDDVILAEYQLEQKVAALYEWAGERLGYVSFRLGANFTTDAATSDSPVPYCDYVENAYGHGIEDADPLMPGHFAYRSVPIKSPVCVPFRVVREVGMYEERLAPYGHDDLEFAIRLLKAGYRNGVFALRFYSDIKWGGTRTTPHPALNRIVERNMGRIRQWRREELEEICAAPQPTGSCEVPGMAGAEETRAGSAAWDRNRQDLVDFQKRVASPLGRVRSAVKRLVS